MKEYREWPEKKDYSKTQEIYQPRIGEVLSGQRSKEQQKSFIKHLMEETGKPKLEEKLTEEEIAKKMSPEFHEEMIMEQKQIEDTQKQLEIEKRNYINSVIAEDVDNLWKMCDYGGELYAQDYQKRNMIINNLENQIKDIDKQIDIASKLEDLSSPFFKLNKQEIQSLTNEKTNEKNKLQNELEKAIKWKNTKLSSQLKQDLDNVNEELDRIYKERWYYQYAWPITDVEELETKNLTDRKDKITSLLNQYKNVKRTKPDTTFYEEAKKLYQTKIEKLPKKYLTKQELKKLEKKREELRQKEIAKKYEEEESARQLTGAYEARIAYPKIEKPFILRALEKKLEEAMQNPNANRLNLTNEQMEYLDVGTKSIEKNEAKRLIKDKSKTLDIEAYKKEKKRKAKQEESLTKKEKRKELIKKEKEARLAPEYPGMEWKNVYKYLSNQPSIYKVFIDEDSLY